MRSLSSAVTIALIVLLAATTVSACCECKCWKINAAIIQQHAWTGCHQATPATFTSTPPYFVERISCDGVCTSQRRLGFFTAGAPYSDAWVDSVALTEVFPCSFHDNRCTTFSPNHCSVADAANATHKSRTSANTAAYLPQVRIGANGRGACPAGQQAKTCKWTNRPCTLRCQQEQKSLCDDDNIFCNFLNHGDLFCVEGGCPNGFFGGSVPGKEPMATILIADTEDY
jgi:hypothetical protein